MKKTSCRNIFPFISLCLLFMLSGCDSSSDTAAGNGKDYTRFINPFIGTAGHGHVFLGANVPAGAVQLGPTNIVQTWDRLNGWDWCSGYNYASTEILGFTHTHLSGTGIGDLNDILLLPANGALQTDPAKPGDMNSGYGSAFSHQNETARPGYYKVLLDKYNITAELTASERVGFHRYKFGRSDNAHLLLDLNFGILWDAPTDTYIEQINDSSFSGYRFSTGWAKDQRVYFAVMLSRPAGKVELFDSTARQNGTTAKGKRLKAAIYVQPGQDSILQVKVGISAVSAENAQLNIAAEIPGWDFNQTVAEANSKWNAALGKIDIEADSVTKTIFYTALYHSLFFPSVFNDHNGDYLGADLKKHHDTSYTNYNLFSLWDTYRGLHPLATLIQPERVNDYINTFLSIYKEQGKLPVWHFQGNETNTMIGYPAVPVIADAYLKGYRGFDAGLAYEAMKHSAMQQSDGINYVQQFRFIPADSIGESVAKAQEYAIADWAIAKMAKAMKREEDYLYFSRRAKLYALYFDSATRFMRGRLSNGAWRSPFDPFSALHRANDYCEGNAWQYTWLVPHDAEGLVRLMGGDEAFTRKLDSLFNATVSLGLNSSPDISGMIGQYAQGNEPNHHIPYLYAYTGQPWKTAEKIRQITDSFFTAKPDGLCGNDDAGEMSAWYVFTAMGFYPVNPAGGIYVMGSPLVSKATINAGKKPFVIYVRNNSRENKYISSMQLNGSSYPLSYLRHKNITEGGELIITMSDKPGLEWGVAAGHRPSAAAEAN